MAPSLAQSEHPAVQRIDGQTGGDPDLHYVIWTPSTAGARGAGEASVSPTLPLVVLVHGAEHSAWCWELVATVLVERYGMTAVGVDLRGHGASTWSQLTRTATLADFGKDVVDVIEAVCVRLQVAPAAATSSVVLVGHSMGGSVADYVARNHPLAGLYILGWATPLQARAAVRGWFLRSLVNPLHPGRAWAFIQAMRGRTRVFATRSLVRAWLLGPRSTKEQVDELFAHLLKEHESLVALQDVVAVGETDARALRAKPGHLTQVWQTSWRRYATGSGDMMMAPKNSAISAQLTGAQFAVLPGLPHDAMLATNHSGEQPGEAVAVDIAEFVLRMPRVSSAESAEAVIGDVTDLPVARAVEQTLRQRH